jgi:dihydrofolate reductase
MIQALQGRGFPDKTKPWVLVAAVANNGVMGRDNSLPWRLSLDLQRFKSLTMGGCLLMGRRTYQSIGKALPGRQTIVLSRGGFQPADPSVAVAPDLQSVEGLVRDERPIMVVGGSEVYRHSLPYCDQLWITRVLTDAVGDAYFPEVDWDQWQLVSTESFPSGPKDDWPTEFERWQRIAPKG